MKRLTILASLIVIATLAGCASNAPETRPYAAEESFQLSMESLNRQGLPVDQYVQARNKLIRAHNENAGIALRGGTVSLGRES